jgi:DNA helicase MCM9
MNQLFFSKTKAHAKLMLKPEVQIMDAIVAISLMECSLNKTAWFGDVNILHTSFPSDAEVEYKGQGLLFLRLFWLNQRTYKTHE